MQRGAVTRVPTGHDVRCRSPPHTLALHAPPPPRAPSAHSHATCTSCSSPHDRPALRRAWRVAGA